MSLQNIVKSVEKDLPVGNFITEDIILESIRDLVKDEIKSHLRKKIEENSQLKEELKEAIELYIEAKLRETFAGVRLAKTGTKLGISMVPEKIATDLSEEFSKLFEKEIVKILEKTI